MGANSILQNDNARPHRARIITDYIHNARINRMERPAFSPDLNHIEHLWDQMGRAVRASVTNATLVDLRRILVYIS